MRMVDKPDRNKDKQSSSSGSSVPTNPARLSTQADSFPDGESPQAFVKLHAPHQDQPAVNHGYIPTDRNLLETPDEQRNNAVIIPNEVAIPVLVLAFLFIFGGSAYAVTHDVRFTGLFLGSSIGIGLIIAMPWILGYLRGVPVSIPEPPAGARTNPIAALFYWIKAWRDALR